MPGRVLVIDDLSTNRIILKVKLSAAYYEVAQATDMLDACEQISITGPDLVLLAQREVSPEGMARNIAALRAAQPKTRHTPIVVLLDSNAPEQRIAALGAGADEVLSRPLEEYVFLARLRRLMRQRLADEDLHHHTLTPEPAGFADAQSAFVTPAQIGLLAHDKHAARKLQSRLAAHMRHGLRMLGAADVIGVDRDKARLAGTAPDLFIMLFDGPDIEDGLRLFSELRADPDTRGCPTIAYLTAEAEAIAPQLLDLGAADVMCASDDPAEIALRIEQQLQRKHDLEKRKSQLQDGLDAAVIDPLTGLYNRRYALSYLNALLRENTCPDGSGFAVMLADLDHFKQVNDTYGHGAGDTVLMQVGQILRDHVRKGDMVARIGGEEFLVIVPGTTKADARALATQLCAQIRNTPMHLPGTSRPAHVTISIGLTLANRQSGTAEALLNLADRALYRSKAEGRNTVRISNRNAA